MRKLILAMQVSLDGFVEGPNGDMSWRASDDPEEWADFFEMVAPVDLFLLGGNMYPDYRNYWLQCLDNPTGCTSDELAFAMLANKSEHIVFSSTLQEAGWANTTIFSGDVAKEIERLKTLPGGDIHLVGGAHLAATVVEAELVDEYWLNIAPVIVGSGKSFFRQQSDCHGLELISTKVLRSGVVIVRYKPKNSI